eukprot:g6631.t1
MQRTINNVQILENFSLARNLDQALAEPEPKTIQEVLEDSRGRFYFKRYACRKFFEECVLFWIQAEEFRKGNFITCAAGSALYVSVTDDDESLMTKRAKRLCKKFIKEDSKLQINISAKDRDALLAHVDRGDISKDLFLDAQAQMKGILEEGHLRDFLHQSSEGQIFLHKKTELQLKKNLAVVKGKKGT